MTEALRYEDFYDPEALATGAPAVGSQGVAEGQWIAEVIPIARVKTEPLTTQNEGHETIDPLVLPERDEFDQDNPAIDILRRYLDEIGEVPLLTAEQEVMLAKRIEAGLYATRKLQQAKEGTTPDVVPKAQTGLVQIEHEGHEAKKRMLTANLRWVVTLAKGYTGNGLDLLDLIQEGTFGLNRAVEKFDYTKGYKFSSYATPWIKKALREAVAEQGRTIRIKTNMVEQINQIKTAQRNFQQDHQRQATTCEVAEMIGKSVERVEEILGYDRAILSLDKPGGNDGFGTSLGDSVASDELEVIDHVVPPLLQAATRAAFARLGEEQQLILRLRLIDEYSLDKVSVMIGLGRETVRKRQVAAMNDLKAHAHDLHLRDYL